MKIRKLPNVLALHLKRFRYQEYLKKYVQHTYRVAFPFELRLFNTDYAQTESKVYLLLDFCLPSSPFLSLTYIILHRPLSSSLHDAPWPTFMQLHVPQVKQFPFHFLRHSCLPFAVRTALPVAPHPENSWQTSDDIDHRLP
jgi:hypothetical protein